jgi:glycosyltransferase involved in cell wall biosynthesis
VNSPALALDLTRLLLAPLSITPRGLDRVELAFANHFLRNWPGECFAVIPTFWGVRFYSRQRALAGIEHVMAMWSEAVSAEDDPIYRSVLAFLHAGRSAHPPARRKSMRVCVRDFMTMLSATGFSFGQSVRHKLPNDAIYLNVGQVSLAYSPYTAWLKHRADVKAVFMMHDIIPLDHPEFVPKAATPGHQRAVRNIAKLANGLIVPTHAAGSSIQRELTRAGRPKICTLAQPLPIAPEFEIRDTGPDPALSSQKYFLICGAIEPRKNHQLLLAIWKSLAAQLGPETPKLVVVGTRSHASSSIIATMEEPELRPHVFEATGLSTPALRRLMANSCALLMPSFAEGFGIPIIEAMSQDAPVLASNLAVHREVGGAYPTYLDPHDADAWKAEIRAHMVPGRRHTGNRPQLATGTAYFPAIERFLLELDPTVPETRRSKRSGTTR